MKKTMILSFLIIGLLVLPLSSWAGVKMKISEDTEIDLGFRVQTQFLATDNDGGDTGDDVEDFRVRRARIRLGGKVTKWTNFFLQTEAASESGTGLDMRLIDAFVTLTGTANRDFWKDYLKRMFLKGFTKDGREYARSTSGLTISEFSKFIEDCLEHLADEGGHLAEWEKREWDAIKRDRIPAGA